MEPDQKSPPDEWHQPNLSSTGAPYQTPSGIDSLQDVTVVEPGETPNRDTEVDEQDDSVLLRWQGTEYLQNNRGTLWYVVFGVVTVVAVFVAIVFLKSITFAVLVPVMVVALLVYVRRDPEILQYILSRKGLYINDKLYPYSQFKAFGIVSSQPSHPAVLVPRKRFQIAQTVYFPQEIGEQLVDMLAERLPMTDIEPDAIDKMLAKIRL